MTIQPSTTPCGNCPYCIYLDTRTRAVLPGGISWRARNLVSCTIKGIVYLLQCLCDSYYVGKTQREFWCRIYDHIYATSFGYFKSPIGRHMALQHSYNFDGFSFLPLSVIPEDSRRGDWDKNLLQIESKWIFQLNACQPPGLNDSLSFKPFLWYLYMFFSSGSVISSVLEIFCNLTMPFPFYWTLGD